MFTMTSVLEALLIVTALSIDAFVSGFAYGANQIKIPIPSILVMNLICSGTLALSLLFGTLLSNWLPPALTLAICILLLLGLGITKIFDSTIKALIRKHQSFQKKIQFSAFHMGFILNVYANPEKADRDHSRVLSPSEAAFLALALSLDGLAVGFGAGIVHTSVLLVVTLSLITDTLAIAISCLLGNRFAQKLQLDLTWLSGALLILLAITKLP
jgi:putative sporulation protein YtaF